MFVWPGVALGQRSLDGAVDMDSDNGRTPQAGRGAGGMIRMELRSSAMIWRSVSVCIGSVVRGAEAMSEKARGVSDTAVMDHTRLRPVCVGWR